MKIRACQVVFFVVGLRKGLRDLLRGEGQALALRYWGICCVVRDRRRRDLPVPIRNSASFAWRGTGPRPTLTCVICVARDRPSPYVTGAWCPPWAPRSTGDARLRAR